MTKSMEKNKQKRKTLGLKAKQSARWIRGRLCPKRKKNAWFIEPMTELPEGYEKSKDVFMYPNYISQFVLPIVEGDMLEFSLGDRDKTRPMAIKVRVSQYSRRTCEELIEYMRNLIECLQSVDFKRVLVQVLPCTAMWRFLGSPVFKSEPDGEFTSTTYLQVLLNLLKLILQHGKRYKTLLKDVIKTVTQGTMIRDTNERSLPNIIKSSNYPKTNSCNSEDEETLLPTELVQTFCYEAIRLVPSVTRCLLPTVTAISEKIPSPSTQRFLCALLTFNSAEENSTIVNSGIWMEIPLVPTDHELAGNLVEKDKNLTPVRTTIPYDNPEQYMDTYFRLVRAETFSAIQHGIKDLKASKLDPRDMNVYSKIRLVGFDLQNRRFALAIHFTPMKTVKKWEASPQLMYGNLVCLSINQRFDDVIWATVSNRDIELLNKHQIITLEVLEENVKNISEIINLLQAQGGSAVMVESPTYYHSLSPILKSLKEFDIENSQLQEEIIYAKPGTDLPSYLKEATIQTAIVCSTTKRTQTIPKDTSQEDCTPEEEKYPPQEEYAPEEELCAQQEDEYAPQDEEDSTQLFGMCSSYSIRSRPTFSSYLTDEGTSDKSSLEKRSNELKQEYRTSSMESLESSSFSSREPVDTLSDFGGKEDTELMETSVEEHTNYDSMIDFDICKAGSDVNEDETSGDEPEDLDYESFENLNVRQSEDIDQSTSISQESLGGRISAERFLDTFNSSSESSLEASQCEALVHALRSRLAVIQGPPGCGKTFVGVKIVQLLLSLSPELEKPILLLTYKNHALDEFLKHMLTFCKLDELVRIGGRSKEPELESCNLKVLQSKISYDKETLTEIQKISSEIATVESSIAKISAEVEASCYLTKRSFVDELTEEQVRSLVLDASWESGSMIYTFQRQKKWNVADKALIKSWLDSVARQFDSVKNFLKKSFEFGVPKKNHEGSHFFKVFQKALQEWFPDRNDIQRMKEFHVEFTLQIENDMTANDDAPTTSDKSDEDDSGDEEYVKQLLDSRMASGSKHGGRSLEDLVLFNPTKTKDEKDILIEISDYPPDMLISSQIRSENNLWSLSEAKRVKFLYCILNENATSVSQELNDLFEELKNLKNRREELEMNDKVEMLSKKKIIGVTITGASLNHDLIHNIGPRVVIVEEAAEILEPSLLAALTPSVEHLILIGDHKQLRPQVDTYDLCRNFYFDVSMMERLIETGFPYKSLARQNRMRPEFSALLHDIYPNLEDNLPLVSKNKPLKCIEKTMFFWTHDGPEKQDRTFTNVKEAERVIVLVLYLLCNGCRPSEITVLAAYLGQTKLLRKMMKQEKTNSPKLFREFDQGKEELDGNVQVQTIDMYQGDENKYLIISLVRSNEENRIGFLNKINRRCVAQSRAKCGMYFVGNVNTLFQAKHSCWTGLITSLMKQDCVANELPLVCENHEASKFKAVDGKGIRDVIDSPKLLCNKLCGNLYQNCEKHPCKKLCFPKHWHTACPKLVDDQFPDCGHYVKRKCPQKISDLRCRVVSIVDLPCGHEGKKKCYEKVSDVVCRIPVTAVFQRCGHTTEKPCHTKIEDMSCQYPCKEMNSCGKHICKSVCGEPHGHDFCPRKINYKFPNCGHPSPKKKKCSEKIHISWKCKETVYFTGDCGHPIKKNCYQRESEAKCKVKPCERTRTCGHPCSNACGDDCDMGECEQCELAYRRKMEQFHAAAKKRVKELEKKIKKKDIPPFSRNEIHGKGSSAAEYQRVKDQVLKFIQPCHHWFPTITKIEKVTNLVLEKKFEAAKSKAFGDYIDTKFHGTSDSGLKSIIRNGFRMPEQNPQPPKKRGMFGQGIYFATDSSKSAQKIYTQDSQKLLLCQVILGKSMTVYEADNTLNRKKLHTRKFDSVYAPRGNAVMNDEFVIFDPDQALPQYIIHFSGSNTVVPPSPLPLTKKRFVVEKMTPSRTVNFKDPFQMYYSFAESHFRRMTARGNRSLPSHQSTISSIDIVINKDLEEKFEETKKKFRSQGIPDGEILAYHGTDQKNIDSILKNNLQLSFARRQAHGKGNYFSEFPVVSLSYGDGLLLCRILPGKEFVDSTSRNIPPGYNSKKVLGIQSARVTAANRNGEMIIIENSDQILPFFVIHRC